MQTSKIKYLSYTQKNRPELYFFTENERIN